MLNLHLKQTKLRKDKKILKNLNNQKSSTLKIQSEYENTLKNLLLFRAYHS